MPEQFYYGGQAVIEGVMIRGRKSIVVAVRRPDGSLAISNEPLKSIFHERLRKMPVIRGIIVLVESLVLGIRALFYSASISLGEEEKTSAGMLWGTFALALALGIFLFALLPPFLVNLIDRYIESSLVSNLLEGLLRICIFLGYIAATGLISEIRRVFAYHGAEHKAVNAYEDGSPLEVVAVRKYSTAHVRCGTSFALIVLVIAIFVFAPLGRPELWLRLTSRVILLPAIAAIGYEFIHFGAAHVKNSLVHAFLAPGLVLQAMTTREPDDKQLEVSIAALKRAVDTDNAEKA